MCIHTRRESQKQANNNILKKNQQLSYSHTQVLSFSVTLPAHLLRIMTNKKYILMGTHNFFFRILRLNSDFY